MLQELSPRETEGIWLITDGKGNKEIAAVLELRESTVKGYVEDAEVDELYSWLERCLDGDEPVDDAMTGSVTRYDQASRGLDVPREKHVLYAHCAAEAWAIFGLRSPSPTKRP